METGEEGFGGYEKLAGSSSSSYDFKVSSSGTETAPIAAAPTTMASNVVLNLPLLGLFHLQSTSVAVLFFSVLLATALLRRFRSGSSSSYPPSPPKIPIIGHLHRLGSLPHRSLAALSREYGPLMLLQLGRVPTLVVSSVEMAEEVLKAQDLVFASRPQFRAVAVVSTGCTPIAMAPYGEPWREARKTAVVHLLSSHRVQDLRPVREAEVARLVGKISDQLSSSLQGSVVDVSRMLSSFTCSFVCRATLGLSDMEEGMTREITELIGRTAAVVGGSQLETFFPGLAWLGKFTGMDARLSELAKRWQAVIRALEEAARHGECKGEGQPAQGKNDDDGTGFGRSSDGMKAVLQEMITGATDTTYITIEGALEELVRNPAAMNKAQEEVRAAVQGRAPMLTDDDVSRMSYLKAVIKETLRLYPPAPLLLPRESMKATRIRGFEIPAKTSVMINAWAIARNPDYWPSPEQFRPERFLRSRIDFKGSDFQFIPFGAGRRSCPGIHFANAAVELALANLLYHFDWSLPENCELGDRGLSMLKRRSLLLVVKPYRAS
ncbi:hypothetical protein Taro_013554 [Colocasia esculenta]|uniref:Uncharacterized protein n=1 Tax=Colocasia esculenta TaxID=4460 RepID=A0A843UMH3_COLES|nr:hypothetical protein [Colocasia esculenta]